MNARLCSDTLITRAREFRSVPQPSPKLSSVSREQEDFGLCPSPLSPSRISLPPPLLHNARVGHGTRAVYVSIRLSPPTVGDGGFMSEDRE
eukprot:2592763-Pyramimonas_sp.AAC.1